MPEEQNGFYREQVFDTINNRLETIEKKVDLLRAQVTYIYAWAAGVGTVAALLANFLLK